MDAEVINLVSEDESPPPVRTPQSNRLKRPRRPTPSPSSDDELVLVSHTKRGDADLRPSQLASPPPAPRLLATRGTPPSNDAVECVGERRGIDALADYPHFRFQCSLELFKRQRAMKKEKYCPRCFCYVCDVPAAQCTTWSVHAKAVDTVPKWRAEREVRLEERRRREQCQNPSQRGTVISRISAPVRVRQVLDDSSSFENGNSSDALDGRGEGYSGEETEEMGVRCDFDRTVEGLDRVAIEADCFRMYELERDLEAPRVERSSRRRAREFNLEELVP